MSLDKAFTDRNGDDVYARHTGETAASRSAARKLNKYKSGGGAKRRINRTSAAKDLYEDWMEPGGKSTSNTGSEFDPYKLGQDYKVEKHKSVPDAKKTGPKSRYRFDSMYLEDVPDSDPEPEPEPKPKTPPKKEEPKKPATPPPEPPPRDPSPPKKEKKRRKKKRPTSQPPPEEPKPQTPPPRQQTPPPAPPPKASSDESDEERERDEYLSWVMNGREDYHKSKKLLFENKHRRPKRR